MKLHTKDTKRVRCAERPGECNFEGTIAELELHDCDREADLVAFGGRCEDYPACGHTDGDGCRPLPSHTSDFYYRNPHLLHEPGSPEWYDAMDDYEPEDED